MTYPTIPLAAFYGDQIEFDTRANKVELGQPGSVIDRSRRHFMNATKRSFSINATLKDRDELQAFLESNRGTPFEFRFDGETAGSLFTTKSWSWSWLVYANGQGVWKLSMEISECFRPGYPPPNAINIVTGFATGIGFDLDFDEDEEITILIPTGNARAVGFDLTIDDISIEIPLGTARGVGFNPSLILGQVAIVLPLGEGVGEGSDIELVIVASVQIDLGEAVGVGTDVDLLPSEIEVAIVLGQAAGVGTDVATNSVATVSIDTGVAEGLGTEVSITPFVDVPLGLSAGFGNNVLIYPGSAIVPINLGVARGTGFNLSLTASGTLLNGLLAYWTLDESSDDAIDSSGNGLTLTSNSAGRTTGKIGNAGNFTLTQDTRFISTSESLRLVTNTFYIAYWIYPTIATSGSAGVVPHSGRYQTEGNNRSFELITSRNDANTQNVFEVLTSTNGTSVARNKNSMPVSLNTWYLLRFYYDAINNQIGLGVNNEALENFSLGSALFNPTMTNAPFRLGRRVGSSAAFGLIDEVGIWNRMLDTAEEAALWNAGAGHTHPFT